MAADSIHELVVAAAAGNRDLADRSAARSHSGIESESQMAGLSPVPLPGSEPGRGKPAEAGTPCLCCALLPAAAQQLDPCSRKGTIRAVLAKAHPQKLASA